MKEIIYALINPSIPYLIKIGRTKNLSQRMLHLYSTGVPTPFECIHAKKVEDAALVESKIHSALASRRVHGRREFFKVSEHEICSLFDLITGTNCNPQAHEVNEPTYSEDENKTKVSWKNGEELKLNCLYGITVTGQSITELMSKIDKLDYENKNPIKKYAKYPTVTSRIKKGWTLEQAFGYEVPPNYTEASSFVQQGYSWFPDKPASDDNTKPVILHSLKRIYVSQKHFSDEHNIPTDYVSDKLKLGWDADRIIESYGSQT